MHPLILTPISPTGLLNRCQSLPDDSDPEHLECHVPVDLSQWWAQGELPDWSGWAVSGLAPVASDRQTDEPGRVIGGGKCNYRRA